MPAKILIVEDDAEIRRGLAIRMRSYGYIVAIAGDAISASSVFHKEQPNLVLLDLGLPGGDGFVVMERIKSVAPDVPFVVLSAMDPEPNRAKSLAAGACAFLQKPVENEDLRIAISRALRNGPQSESLALSVSEQKKSLVALVVEDDMDTSRALSIRLSSRGYIVLLASDGVFALTIAQRQHPDVIILDIALPGGDGITVMDRLRKMGLEIPIVVLSAREPEVKGRVVKVRERELARDRNGVGLVHAKPGGLREEKAQQRSRGQDDERDRPRVKLPAGK